MERLERSDEPASEAQGLESAREVAQAALDGAQEQVSRTEAAVTAARLELSRAEADAERARLVLERAERASARPDADTSSSGN